MTSAGNTTTPPMAVSVAGLYRYPVKSMLGEAVEVTHVGPGGASGDRRLALVDLETGHVASAKQPRKWGRLLQMVARADTGEVVIETVDGDDLAADDPSVHEVLSGLVGRPVKLTEHRDRGATLERPDPEQLLESGLEAAGTAEIDTPVLEIAGATPGHTFHDVAPVHAITTATLEQVGVETLRYRPNLVLRTPAGCPPYVENHWVGREIVIGELRLRVLKPTHRCVIPTLDHGELPKAPHALRTLMTENRVASADGRRLPCAGVYLEVVTPGTIALGEPGQISGPATSG